MALKFLGTLVAEPLHRKKEELRFARVALGIRAKLRTEHGSYSFVNLTGGNAQ
jgi:hypothetical protein